MTPFEKDKRKRNLLSGYKETKGLRDGHCNRYACQKPLADESEMTGRRYSMIDHETFTTGRLYYCCRCSIEFNKVDDQMNRERRITVETTNERTMQ